MHISHYLGHASPATTNHYPKGDLGIKRQAICAGQTSSTRYAYTVEERGKEPTVLDWLESL